MGRRKRHEHHEEHENHERWLVSYADFITLLFAFFVVLYAASQVDPAKASAVANSIRFALHFQESGGPARIPIMTGTSAEGGCPTQTRDASNAQAAQQQMQQAQKRIEQRLGKYLKEQKNIVQVVVDGHKLSVRLHAGTFFDPASAALRPEVLPVLDAVAEELSALQRSVKVEGHTDHTPVQGSVFPTNWHLSASRAAAVSAYMVDKHTFGRELLSATGYADTRPLQSNDTEEGREANRRIELVVNVSPDDNLDAITR